MYMFTRAHTHMCTHTGIHTCMHAGRCIHTCTHTCIHTYICAHIHTCTHMYLHIHTHTHTCTLGLGEVAQVLLLSCLSPRCRSLSQLLAALMKLPGELGQARSCPGCSCIPGVSLWCGAQCPLSPWSLAITPMPPWMPVSDPGQADLWAATTCTSFL